MLVVSDTSPLRALQALELVPLLDQLYGSVYLPPAVVSELAVEAPSVGALRAADYSFLIVRAPSDAALVSRLLSELNVGEAEALALAVELHADTVLIDESLGRRIAARLGLRTRGVLALLVEAKSKGLIEAVAPLLERLDLRIRFRISEELRARILRDAGEND